MQKDFNKIELIIDRLQRLQLDHIESFNKKGDTPDIEQQSFDREKEFNNLKNRINNFNNRAQVETDAQVKAQIESMLVTIKNKIATLIEQNTTLETKVKEYRDKIKDSMKKISTGKKVIGSYGSSAKITNNPKVISITN